jgi:hypothetical protein
MMMGSLPTVIAIGRSSPRASARQLHGNVALRHGLNSDTVRALHHEPIAPDILHVVDVEAPSPRLRRNSGIRSKRLMSLQFSQGPAMPSPSTRNCQLIGGNAAASKKNWHTATHQILARPTCCPGDFKIQLVSPRLGWAGRPRKQQRPACGSSHRTCA